MVKMKKPCKYCGDEKLKEVELKNEVPQKEDWYYFECEKGHILKFLVPKRSMQLLEKRGV